MLKPIGDRVLIKPAVNPTVTESGLHLAEAWTPEQHGTVIAVGMHEHPRKKDLEEFIGERWLTESEIELLQSLVAREPAVKVGDYVIFSWQTGQEVRIDDERYLLMRERDILAVLEDEGVPV